MRSVGRRQFLHGLTAAGTATWLGVRPSPVAASAASSMLPGAIPREWPRPSLKDIPYNKWREYDHEDTVRFYALRLHEAAMIRSTPQKILVQGTDWRFINELKKELKG